MSRDSRAKKNEQILSELLREDSNRQCADCGQKGTRWASWNIGVFLCIRCGGLHRKLGTHISRVKSVTLDSWTDEEVLSIKNKGNARINAIFNPDPSRFPFPAFSGDMEQYIRDKYERKLFMNPGPRTAYSSPSLSTTASKPLSLGPGPSAKMFSRELGQLRDMGFRDEAKCMQALQQTSGNISDSIDVLSRVKTAPLPNQDNVQSLLNDDFSGLSLESHKAFSSNNNDWTDLEFSKPLEYSFQSKAESKTSPLPDLSNVAISDTFAQPQIPELSVPEELTGHSEKTSEVLPSVSADPWGAPPPSSPNNLGSMLGSNKLFGADDDDPFKDLTHNPFQ